MSDQRLRLLERSTEPADRARLLLERLRRGSISLDGVKWAARLGREDARTAVGDLALPPLDWTSWWDRDYAIRGVAEAVGGLALRRIVVSFAVDCAERVLTSFEAAFPGDGRPRDTVSAARRWGVAPSRESRERVVAARRAGRALEEAMERDLGPGLGLDRLVAGPFARDVPAPLLATRAALAAADAVHTRHDETAGSASHAAEHASRAAADPRAEYDWQRLRLAAYALGEVALPAAHGTKEGAS